MLKNKSFSADFFKSLGFTSAWSKSRYFSADFFKSLGFKSAWSKSRSFSADFFKSLGFQSVWSKSESLSADFFKSFGWKSLGDFMRVWDSGEFSKALRFLVSRKLRMGSKGSFELESTFTIAGSWPSS